MESLETEFPTFSVIIPVYNKGPYIERCIKSVLSQSFKNFEIIVVHDPSTDNSLKEIEKFSKYINLYNRDKPGPGGYAARNLGIKKAKGEWLVFLDADDEWFPSHLSSLYSGIKKFGNLNFWGAGWFKKRNNKSLEDKYYKKNSNKGVHKISISEYLENSIYGRRPVFTSVACVKRKSLTDTNLFPSNTNYKKGGDIFTWLKTIIKETGMGWSNHIGASYYTDVDGSVTKTSSVSVSMYSRDNFMDLATNLNSSEKNQLAILFNQRIYKIWYQEIIANGKSFELQSFLINDSASRIASMKFKCISYLPNTLIKIIFKIGHNLKYKFHDLKFKFKN